MIYIESFFKKKDIHSSSWKAIPRSILCRPASTIGWENCSYCGEIRFKKECGARVVLQSATKTKENEICCATLTTTSTRRTTRTTKWFWWLLIIILIIFNSIISFLTIILHLHLHVLVLLLTIIILSIKQKGHFIWNNLYYWWYKYVQYIFNLLLPPPFRPTFQFLCIVLILLINLRNQQQNKTKRIAIFSFYFAMTKLILD